MNIPIQIRLATNKDLPLIYSSWIGKMKHLYPNNMALDFTKYYNHYLDKLIPNSTILIAHLEDEPNEIISYLVYSSFHSNHLVIHYGYTKLDARQQGIINKLIQFSNPNNLPILFTHPCNNENLMTILCKKYIYDPSILGVLL